jgi:rhamnosyltransferase
MASSAIRRSVWEDLRFNEGLKISEDVDWTWRARQRGFTVRYAPDSVVLHSHNYSLREYARRQYLEGRDEALIFDWPRWQRSLLRHSLLPWARRMLSDWRYCLGRLAFRPAFWSPVLRTVQLVSRRAGFRAGLREVSR